jgi:hypothetical protein
MHRLNSTTSAQEKTTDCLYQTYYDDWGKQIKGHCGAQECMDRLRRGNGWCAIFTNTAAKPQTPVTAFFPVIEVHNWDRSQGSMLSNITEVDEATTARSLPDSSASTYALSKGWETQGVDFATSAFEKRGKMACSAKSKTFQNRKRNASKGCFGAGKVWGKLQTFFWAIWIDWRAKKTPSPKNRLGREFGVSQ